MVLTTLVRALVSGSTVYTGRFTFDPAATNAAFVTEPFDLNGRPSNVDVSLATNLSNNWLSFSLALINDEKGDALDFRPRARVLLRRRGRRVVVLWIAARGCDRAGVCRRAATICASSRKAIRANRTLVDYSIRVRRDKPVWSYYGVALLLLAIPPIWVTFRHSAFERERWSQSDTGGGKAHSEEDDE